MWGKWSHLATPSIYYYFCVQGTKWSAGNEIQLAVYKANAWPSVLLLQPLVSRILIAMLTKHLLVLIYKLLMISSYL